MSQQKIIFLRFIRVLDTSVPGTTYFLRTCLRAWLPHPMAFHQGLMLPELNLQMAVSASADFRFSSYSPQCDTGMCCRRASRGDRRKPLLNKPLLRPAEAV